MLMFLSTDLSTGHVTTTRYPQGYPQKSPRYPQMRLYVKASPVTRDALRGGRVCVLQRDTCHMACTGPLGALRLYVPLHVACTHDAGRLPLVGTRSRDE